MLSIPAQELEQHGSGVAFTAQAMASQARKLTGSDYGVSLTGVAGPDSLEGHPAGTVFIGLATPSGVDSVQVNIAGRSRSDVREIAVLHAFNLVRLAVLNGEIWYNEACAKWKNNSKMDRKCAFQMDGKRR